jgi:membrane protein DedA with SNARE-associated domain
MVTGILHHAQWVVFALILANQAGVPVFAAPALLGVGALAWIGDVNVGAVVIAAVGASLCADLIWYSVGRRRGQLALATLRRLSRGVSTFLDDAQRLFLAHDRAFQFGARFLPELNPVAAAFAGVAGVSVRRFFLGGAVSAAVWAGAWIGVGYLIARVTSRGGGSGLPFVALIVTAVAILGVNAYVARGRRAAVLDDGITTVLGRMMRAFDEPATLLRPHMIIRALAQSLRGDRRRKVDAATSVIGHDGGRSG